MDWFETGTETGSGHCRARSAASDLSRWTVKNWQVSVSVYETLMSYGPILLHYDTMLDLFLQSPISTEPSHSNPWNLKFLSPTPTPSDISISGDSGSWLDNFALKSPDILTTQGFVRSMALFGLTPQNLFLRDGGARQRQASWWNCW